MLHVKTRKRDLTDRLHAFGMSISYDHVLRLSSDMANAVCEHFKETDTVCPPNLTRNVFTTAAVDNVDHNTSSTTAITSFHGTSISLIQLTNEHGEEQSNRLRDRDNSPDNSPRQLEMGKPLVRKPKQWYRGQLTTENGNST